MSIIGTGITTYFAAAGAGGSEVQPNEYFLGYKTEGVTIQHLLDRYSLTISSGEIPVLSVAIPTDNGYVIEKYFVQLSSGATYAPLGDYATEKTIILIPRLYPNAQSADAALEAVNAFVFPDFTLNNLSELVNHLNTSISIDRSDPETIYYFRFTVGADQYVYVLSEATQRGIYGYGLLQFTSDDLLPFFSSSQADTSLLDEKLNKPASTPVTEEAVTVEGGITKTKKLKQFFIVDETASAFNTVDELVNIGKYSTANGFTKGTKIYFPNLTPPRIYTKFGNEDTKWLVTNTTQLPTT